MEPVGVSDSLSYLIYFKNITPFTALLDVIKSFHFSKYKKPAKAGNDL